MLRQQQGQLVDGKLEFREGVKLVAGEPAGFSGVLTAFEAAAQRQSWVVVPEFGQQLLHFGSESLRGADAFQGGLGGDVAGLDAEELAALEFAAARGPFSVDGASARAGIKGGAGLVDTRATGEQWGLVPRLGADIGEEDAVAAEAALQAEGVSEYGHQRISKIALHVNGRSK